MTKKKDPLSMLLTWMLLLSIAGAGYSYSKLDDLPSQKSIRAELHQEPRQFPTREPEFTFTYRGTDYGVVPVAEYELWGLVVSHNDILEFSDIYHDENSVDIKDICVVWGYNIDTDNFRELEYYSEPWTCFYRTDDSEVYEEFEPQALSNNHLLSDDPHIRELISNTRIGDQIHLKGMLVNYFPESRPSWIRPSSTSRDDTGNGACEVVFVESYNILKRANERWWSLYRICLTAVTALLGIKLALFLNSVYRRPPLS